MEVAMVAATKDQIEPVDPTLRGDQYRRHHRESVAAILGPEAVRVSSKGSQFINFDRWTSRFLVKQMCEWADANPSCVPDRKVTEEWVHNANSTRAPKPEIIIAHTPEKLPLRIALALTGGAYHEAFHTLWSCRRSLGVDEIYKLVVPRWALVPDWSKYFEMLLDWSNIVEDIRIERRGLEQFPGVEIKLHDLQDYILRQEADGKARLRAHGIQADDSNNTLSIVMKTFREVGLGYVTDMTQDALDQYQQEDPDAVSFVLAGPLSPMLHEAIDLSTKDDLGNLRLALEIVAELVANSKDPKPQPKAAKGQGVDRCPQCGAGPDKLVVRLKAGSPQGLITCTVCGWQEVVDLENPQPGSSPQGQPLRALLEKDGDKGDDTHGDVAGKALDDAAKEGTNLLDNNTALGGSFKEINETEEGQTKPGECSWRPYDQSFDEVRFVGPSENGLAHDQRKADNLYQSVRLECSYLRARMRSLFLATKMTAVMHGTPRGRRLSERNLVDSRVTLMGGEMPTRAYMDRTEQQDVTVAAAIILDQSSSMWNNLELATSVMLAIAEPIDSLQGAVLAAGFRDGAHHANVPKGDKGKYHRTRSVVHDVFKAYDERLSEVRWRFANTTATGYTPMADGIQFGFESLRFRPETLKLIYLVTDGLPDSGHRPVVKKQIRMCQELGIGLIGVGIGQGAEYIKDLIPNNLVAKTGHVYSKGISDLPPLIIKKTSDVLDLHVFSPGTA